MPLLFLLLLLLVVQLSLSQIPVCRPKPGTPPNTPFGTGRGIKPGRVSWFYDRKACNWDGKTKFWWNKEYLDLARVETMLEKTVLSVSGLGISGDLKDAWDRIFRQFNKKHFGKDVGYTKGEKLAVKVNLNVVPNYIQDKLDNSISPQFMRSLVTQLVESAGVPQERITLFDASRPFPLIYWAGEAGIGTKFPNVRIVDNFGDQPYAVEAKPDPRTKFYFADRKVPGWNTTLLPLTVREAKYVIQVDAFRGHDLASITATGKNWFGGIYRQDVWCPFFDKTHPGHWCPASLHAFVNTTGERLPTMPGPWLPPHPMGVYNPLVDLMGHDDLSAKGLIFLSDGLYSGIAEASQIFHGVFHSDIPIRFVMPPFNNDWSCSTFASLDPIALDSVLFDFLLDNRFRRLDVLHEGAMAHSPPSGTTYAPSGHPLKSLGVHEHWNNMKEKLYSRNMGHDNGIELVKVHEEK